MTGARTARDRWIAVRWYGLQAAVVALGVVVYFGIRSLTEGSPDTAVDHAEDIMALERALGLDLEAWAQGLVVDSDALSTFANWIYIWGHWPVIVGTMLWLALRHPRHFLRLRNAMLASGGIGLLVYATYPVAPPRLAGTGMVDTVTERSQAYRVLQPPAFTNQYAAMPSLHVGWDLVVGIVVIGAASVLWLRWLAGLMPVLMVVSTVVTANHYILDVIAGAVLGCIGLAVALLIEARALAVAPPTSRQPALPDPAPGAPSRSPAGSPAGAVTASPPAVVTRQVQRDDRSAILPRPRPRPDSDTHAEADPTL